MKVYFIFSIEDYPGGGITLLTQTFETLKSEFRARIRSIHRVNRVENQV